MLAKNFCKTRIKPDPYFRGTGLCPVCPVGFYKVYSGAISHP